MFIRSDEPSPSMSITSLSGCATLMAERRRVAKAMEPSPPLVMNWRGREYLYHWPAHI